MQGLTASVQKQQTPTAVAAARSLARPSARSLRCRRRPFATTPHRRSQEKNKGRRPPLCACFAVRRSAPACVLEQRKIFGRLRRQSGLYGGVGGATNESARYPPSPPLAVTAVTAAATAAAATAVARPAVERSAGCCCVRAPPPVLSLYCNKTLAHPSRKTLVDGCKIGNERNELLVGCRQLFIWLLIALLIGGGCKLRIDGSGKLQYDSLRRFLSIVRRRRCRSRAGLTFNFTLVYARRDEARRARTLDANDDAPLVGRPFGRWRSPTAAQKECERSCCSLQRTRDAYGMYSPSSLSSSSSTSTLASSEDIIIVRARTRSRHALPLVGRLMKRPSSCLWRRWRQNAAICTLYATFAVVVVVVAIVVVVILAPHDCGDDGGDGGDGGGGCSLPLFRCSQAARMLVIAGKIFWLESAHARARQRAPERNYEIVRLPSFRWSTSKPPIIPQLFMGRASARCSFCFAHRRWRRPRGQFARLRNRAPRRLPAARWRRRR